MAQNNDATDATLTEYLASTDEGHPEIPGPAKITYARDGRGLWGADEGEELDEEPSEYKCVCSCGGVFSSWGAATNHVEQDH